MIYFNGYQSSLRGGCNSKSLAVFLSKSSDEDLIFIGQASMDIKIDLQKKEKRISYVRRNPTQKDTF